MHYIAIIVLLHGFATKLSVQQQCAVGPSYINQITNAYLDVLKTAEDNTPISLTMDTNAGQQIFAQMVNMMGVDGDMPWALDVLDSLLQTKAKRLYNYELYILPFIRDYFANNYMPALRNALSEFAWDPLLQFLVNQVVQGGAQRLAYSVDYLKVAAYKVNVIFEQLARVVIDINRRAIAARMSGQMDLSAIEAELKTLQVNTYSRLAVWTKYEDDTFDSTMQGLVAQFVALVNAIEKRYWELKRPITICVR